MNVLLALLFLASLALGVAVLLSVSRSRRGTWLRSRRGQRSLGAAQLAIGALWVLWGVVYYKMGGRGSGGGGLLGVVLGALWCLQGLRRITARSGRGT